jgi:hypothetical protein
MNEVYEIYERKSRFQSLFNVDMREFSYQAHFREDVARLLQNKGIKDYDYSDELRKYNLDDGVNGISVLLYEQDEYFTALYHSFIREISAYFPPFYFQATPTIRIQCSGENDHHYPRWHTDIGYGHPPGEINIWIPLTMPVHPQNHGFRLKSVFGSKAVLWYFNFDFEPFIKRAVEDAEFNKALYADSMSPATEVGKFIAFDSRCIHTGEPMIDHTRASIDIRIIPVDDFKAQKQIYQGTGRRKIRYVPGDGYNIKSSEEI